ncbi:MAG: beta-propeller domain-containing protein [Nanoarchaeota archaeon]
MDKDLSVVLWLGVVLIGFVAVLVVFSSDGVVVGEDVSLDKFNSYDELKSFLKENTQQTAGVGLFGGTTEVASITSSDSEASLRSNLESSSASAGTYSQTNIQVVGVDEPDVVKNDGKYIYQIVQNNKVVIVDAFPASEMKIVSELEFDNNVVGLFVYDNKLIVIEAVYGYYSYGRPEIATDAVASTAVAVDGFVAPVEQTRPEVKVHVYDLTDIENLELEDTFVSKGNYYTARMIDGVVYVVSNYYADTENPVLPVFASDAGTREVAVSDIYYPVIGDSSFLFTSVLGVDVLGLEFSGDVFLTGNSGVSYVSRDALYLTHQKYFDYGKFQEDMIREVFLPLLPADDRSDAEEIIDSDEPYYTKSRDMEQIFAGYFNELTEEEKKTLQEELQESMQEFASSWSKKYQKTAIHKIELDGLDISYAGSGEVPGYLLNQFSLDEDDGYLRVATTIGEAWFGAGSTMSGNNLYVLDENLEIVGSVEDLAPGERIYSTRFVGDKAYMVTFRQVDPLYVIDLSDEENPKVLGYLKVTGFSNYLQPYDDKHLIGIGHEATLEGRQQGLKISLFDVSDFENPLEVDKYVFEGGWSSSEAEYEHKAVLFDKEKNLLVIPVSTNNYDYNSYWQGAYVFDIDTQGIGLRGKISHDESTDGSYYYNSYVRRSLYLDDVLYTISDKKIKANDLNTLDNIKSLVLPVEEIEVQPVVY